jgi:plastocyanin
VTWTNVDAIVHTVTSGDSDGRVGTPSGLFDSGDMVQGDQFSFTFDEPGTYPYYCVPHPWMTGTVIVEG